MNPGSNSPLFRHYNCTEITTLAEGEPVKRNLPRITIHAMLAASILLGASWLARSTSQARATHESPRQAAPLGPYDIYMPLVASQSQPPMVELGDAYLANGSGDQQSAFLAGSVLQYVTSGSNDFSFPISVTRRWMRSEE